MELVDDYLSALKKLRRNVDSGVLARCVTRQAVESSAPPNFLYASGRPGRYNPEGVECIYWEEEHISQKAERKPSA
jgi:hypothetical protein